MKTIILKPHIMEDGVVIYTNKENFMDAPRNRGLTRARIIASGRNLQDKIVNEGIITGVIERYSSTTQLKEADMLYNLTKKCDIIPDMKNNIIDGDEILMIFCVNVEHRICWYNRVLLYKVDYDDYHKEIKIIIDN